MKPRVEANLAHEAYYFCYDDTDPDVVCVFQLCSDHGSIEAFMEGDWYPDYLNEVSQVVAAEPQIIPATPVWTKQV